MVSTVPSPYVTVKRERPQVLPRNVYALKFLWSEESSRTSMLAGGSTFNEMTGLAYFRNRRASISWGSTYPGTPTATGRRLSASVVSICRIESETRNFKPYVFDSPGARLRRVGVFQGLACFHSFSA